MRRPTKSILFVRRGRRLKRFGRIVPLGARPLLAGDRMNVFLFFHRVGRLIRVNFSQFQRRCGRLLTGIMLRVRTLFMMKRSIRGVSYVGHLCRLARWY